MNTNNSEAEIKKIKAYLKTKREHLPLTSLFWEFKERKTDENEGVTSSFYNTTKYRPTQHFKLVSTTINLLDNEFKKK